MECSAKISEIESINSFEQNVIDQELLVTCVSLLRENGVYEDLQIMENQGRKFSKEEKEVLQMNINQYCNPVISRMNNTFPDLTKEDLLYCILYVLGCKHATVRAIMGVEEGALKTRRSRIKKKIGEVAYQIIFRM